MKLVVKSSSGFLMSIGRSWREVHQLSKQYELTLTFVRGIQCLGARVTLLELTDAVFDAHAIFGDVAIGI
jgi:hypothetical protein